MSTFISSHLSFHLTSNPPTIPNPSSMESCNSFIFPVTPDTPYHLTSFSHSRFPFTKSTPSTRFPSSTLSSVPSFPPLSISKHSSLPHHTPMIDNTLLGSSLSSRSHATTEQSSSTVAAAVVPRLSFRHRRRTKDSFVRSDNNRPSDPPALTLKPWHRIRTRLSVMDDLSHLPPASATRATTNPHDPDLPQASDFSETASTTTSPTSSRNNKKLKQVTVPRMLSAKVPPSKRPPIRTLMPPPRSNYFEKNIASITEFLLPTNVPANTNPESVDTSFKGHINLLRKTTLDKFDLNRHLFGYKPLARVNSVLATTLLYVTDIDQKNFPMSPALRSTVMYIAGNAHRNVYVMTYAAQLKSIGRSRPATEGTLAPMVLEGRHLSEYEVAALDFAQEVSWPTAVVAEGTRRRILDGSIAPDGRMERIISGTSAYGAFLSCLTSTVDVELTHASIQYASNNLQGLPWKSSGTPVNVGFLDADMGDFGSNAPSGFGSKYRPKRERLSLTRNYDRHNREKNSGGRSRTRGIRRVSQFFTSSLMGPKAVTDMQKSTENWMKNVGVPPAGQLFDINDEILSLFGFHPFYFSTAAMEAECSRRAFLYGAKELLFAEKEIPKRLKFIICYVLSSGKERRRILDSDHSRSFEAPGVHNGHSITSVYSHRTYDSLSIMSAHAAFLGCKYGATPAELVAATDVSRVRSAMERYLQDRESSLSSHSLGFPLTRRDCAAVLIAHSLLSESPCIEESTLRGFERTYSAPVKGHDEVNRSSRRAFLELLGAASMWSAFERYATGTLAFDVDLTSNMMFACGRAEPTISEFCRSADGKKIGLSLAASESRDVLRGRSDSRASRTSSLRPNMKSGKRMYRKRTSSALNTNSRVGRMFGGGSTDVSSEKAALASA